MKKNIIILLLLFLPTFFYAQNNVIFSLFNDYINQDGKVVFSTPEGYVFSESLHGEGYGFDKRNPNFSNAFAFLNLENDEIILINKDGKKIANLGNKYHFISSYDGNIAIAFRVLPDKNGATMLSYIDEKGKSLLNGKEFWEADYFSDGLAAVQEKEGGDWTYIDFKGNIVINVRKLFPNGNLKLEPFEKETALISVDEYGQDKYKYYLINKKGEILVDFDKQFDGIFAIGKIKGGEYSMVTTTNGCKGLCKEISIIDAQGKIVNKFYSHKNNQALNFTGLSRIDAKYNTISLYYYKPGNQNDSCVFVDLKGNYIFHKKDWYGFALNSTTLILQKGPEVDIDSVGLYSIPQQKMLIQTKGSAIFRENTEFVKIPKSHDELNAAIIYNYQSNSFCYNKEGKLIYETPKNTKYYNFSNFKTYSDFYNINKNEVEKGIFRVVSVQKAAEFINLKEAKIVLESYTQLPKSIGNLTKLEDLELEGFDVNLEREMPQSFQNLKNLKHLTLKSCYFKNLSELLKQLPKLEWIDVIYKENSSLHLKEIENWKQILPNIHIEIQLEDRKDIEVMIAPPMEAPSPAIGIQTTSNEEEIYAVVDQQAEFPESNQALFKWISDNINYPEQAKKENIQGRVIMRFVVEKDGTFTNISVLRGVHKLLDEEAIRLTKSMPIWKPGRQKGEIVRSYFTLPIIFKL
jgi:TonB family protein